MATNYIKSMQTNSDNLIESISAKSLRQNDRTISQPFQLSLENNNDPLICDEVVRIISGKRIVAFGRFKNQPVVAKLFFQQHTAKKQAERDAAGVTLLQEAKIPTPKLLLQTTSSDKKIHVLLFERIFDTLSFDLTKEEKNHPEFFLQTLKTLTIELATQHVLGIVQKDLHLKNFLITDKTIYTLDGANIIQTDGILPKKQSLEHLALFFSQLGVGKEKLYESLYELYAQSRGWPLKPTDFHFLQNAAMKNTLERWQRFQKKIFRNSTAFSRNKTSSALIIYDRQYQSAELMHVLAEPEAIFQDKNTEILKAGNTATVAKIKIKNKYYVIKRYNIKNHWHFLRRSLRPTRAVTSWQLAQQLTFFGIATAKPIAFIEERIFGLRSTSYFLMEWIEGEHAGDYFAKHKSTAVAQRIILLLTQLAKLGLTHGDLKMTNILIENHHPLLIDLDGMVEHKTISGLKRAFDKELRRFMRNWEGREEIGMLFQRLIKTS